MNFRMGKILGFWVDAEYESRRFQVRQSKTKLFCQILLEWEEDGDAMRYLDRSGRIRWKATPNFLERLHDAELEAKEELEVL
jgi:hypothetical protein